MRYSRVAMTKKKHTFEEIADSDFDLRKITDLEWLVLKTHIYVETMLRRVLSDKLGLPEDSPALMEMQFSRMAELALGGPNEKSLLEHAGALNAARNAIAHELYVSPGSEAVEAFVAMAIRPRRPDYQWPNAHEEEARRRDFVHAATALIRPLIDMMTPREASWPMARTARKPLLKPRRK